VDLFGSISIAMSQPSSRQHCTLWQIMAAVAGASKRKLQPNNIPSAISAHLIHTFTTHLLLPSHSPAPLLFISARAVRDFVLVKEFGTGNASLASPLSLRLLILSPLIFMIARAVRDFVLVKEIGTGNASTVWYAFCKKTSAPLAIKTYKKRKLSPLNRCQVAREINIHAQLDHPNVIALVRCFV
jgi:hypothetical protein